MAHYACLCPEVPGHLNPTLAIGWQLRERGHKVTFVGVRDAQRAVNAAGLEYHPLGETAFPTGTIPQLASRLGRLEGFAAVRCTLNHAQDFSSVILQELPAILKRLQVDGLIIDQLRHADIAVAQSMQIPFVTICNALTFHREPNVPPPAFHWNYRSDWLGRIRNQMGWRGIDFLSRPALKLINQHRRQWKQPPCRSLTQLDSPLAQLCQLPESFDFPRQALAPWFHYVGSWTQEQSRASVPFPYERLNDQPLIYASMGTLQNRLFGTFRNLIEACQGLDAQLVVSLGSSDPSTLPDLPPGPIIVPHAPQLQLLKRAAMTITHAGMNTTSESLAQGVPMVALPVTNDQPGVAARIEHSGVGKMMIPRKRQVSDLRRAFSDVLSNPKYRQRAAQIQEDILTNGGASRAAEIVERALSTNQPVIREGQTNLGS
ncbi:MurG-like transferase [Roseimaritima multifibrata]|uniref:MurG-like transferase n=1 Tax=Roseimaritima multifibrata TaxID=1930274 RepID=A0A517MAR5_9BACT|nr:nucleotide disphospho-sugar-binding domain-containing protein [Roseimaritima multifibrata]QDS91976.1 MurG-like transferase [Roseimaritima multifibrata]